MVDQKRIFYIRAHYGTLLISSDPFKLGRYNIGFSFNDGKISFKRRKNDRGIKLKEYI